MIGAATLAGARIPHMGAVPPPPVAAPVLESQTVSNLAFASSWVLTPPSGVQAGDLLLVLFSSYAGGQLPSANVEWTLLATEINGGGTGIRSALFARIATGSDAITVSVNPGSNTWASYSYFRISGADSVLDVESASAIHDAVSASVTFPALSPTGGVLDRLWIAGFLWSGTAGVTASGFPSGYVSTQQSAAAADTNRTTSGSAVSTQSSASETPGAATLSASATNWQSWTIAVRS